MKKLQTLCVLAGFVFLLAGCQPQVVEVEVTRLIQNEVLEEVEVIKEVEVEKVTEVERVIAVQSTAVFKDTDETASITDGEISTSSSNSNSDSSSAERTTSPQRRARLIIKDGNIEVTVEDSQRALDNVGQLVTATGGYIIGQRVYKLDEFDYVTMQIGVPVEEFERAMESIRKLGTVTQDSATGVDVTDEFVDLESRLGNLQIKQERLRTFMSEAKKIEDVLKVEKELSEVEEELNVIQGRISYLKDRSSFSTISIQINPLVPTATPSPTPTSTPIPTPSNWRPGDTAQVAAVELQETSQSFANGIIYVGIVCGPWLFLVLLVGWALFLLNQKYGTRYELPTRLRKPERTDSTILSGEAENDSETEIN